MMKRNTLISRIVEWFATHDPPEKLTYILPTVAAALSVIALIFSISQT